MNINIENQIIEIEIKKDTWVYAWYGFNRFALPFSFSWIRWSRGGYDIDVSFLCFTIGIERCKNV